MGLKANFPVDVRAFWNVISKILSRMIPPLKDIDSLSHLAQEVSSVQFFTPGVCHQVFCKWSVNNLGFAGQEEKKYYVGTCVTRGKNFPQMF